MTRARCEDCGHVHGGGYCAESCARCIAEDRRERLGLYEQEELFDADELGLDPEDDDARRYGTQS